MTDTNTGAVTFITGTARMEWREQGLWAGQMRLGRVLRLRPGAWASYLEYSPEPAAGFSTEAEAKLALIEAVRREMFLEAS